MGSCRRPALRILARDVTEALSQLFLATATAKGKSERVHAGVMFQGTKLSPVGAALAEPEGPGRPHGSPRALAALASAPPAPHTVRLLVSPHGAALRNARPATTSGLTSRLHEGGRRGARWTPRGAPGPACSVSDQPPKAGGLPTPRAPVWAAGARPPGSSPQAAETAAAGLRVPQCCDLRCVRPQTCMLKSSPLE